MAAAEEYGARARAMTRAEWRALRQATRDQWSAEARRQHALAMRNQKRFGIFLIVMVILSGVLGAVIR